MATGGAAVFLLRETPGDDARDDALDLLEHAGWARPLLDGWAAGGAVLELYDPADDGPRGDFARTSSRTAMCYLNKNMCFSLHCRIHEGLINYFSSRPWSVVCGPL